MNNYTGPRRGDRVQFTAAARVLQRRRLGGVEGALVELDDPTISAMRGGIPDTATTVQLWLPLEALTQLRPTSPDEPAN
jgi:hypothetical protein